MTKTHIIMFMVYSFALLVFMAIYMFVLTEDMATCENNPSKFCPSIYDSKGLVNKPNPNSAVQYGIGGTTPYSNKS